MEALVLCCALRAVQTLRFKIQGSQCLFQGFGVSLKRTLLCLAVNIGGPPKCGNSFGPPPKCGEICCGWPLRFAHRMKNASSERLCTKTKLCLQKKASYGFRAHNQFSTTRRSQVRCEAALYCSYSFTVSKLLQTHAREWGGLPLCTIMAMHYFVPLHSLRRQKGVAHCSRHAGESKGGCEVR
jgi:hypothetical protein